jgi:glucose uptake protein GlcU
VGSTVDWIRVLGTGGIYGVLMFLGGIIFKWVSVARPLSLAALAFSSLLFGMMMVFEWRVLHGAIGVVFAMAIIGLFVTGLVERRSRKRSEIASRTP